MLLPTLTVTKAGTGTGTITSDPAGIDCGATCAFAFAYNTSVILTPAAPVGSVFTGWGGDCTGTAACQVTMDAAKSVTASFTAVVVLGSPNGDLASWGNSFNWTGVSPATYYIYEIYNAGDVRLLQKWYTTAEAGCDGDLSCGVSPAARRTWRTGSTTGG